MKELEFIEIIKNTLTKNTHLGDDCAYLKDLNIVVTQDSLIEDIHFCSKFSTPYMLGYKSIMVNLSDIFASGAIPKYFTISLSLPENTDKNFIKEFYRACEDLSKEFDFEIIGGDITGAEKILISACAIGITKGRKISSRSYAKAGDLVFTTGNHGSSAAGLFLLREEERGKKEKESAHCSLLTAHLKNTHLLPQLNKIFSREIATKSNRNFAMMDTSDGLADALFKIAKASNLTISVDFEKVPYDKAIEDIAKEANINFQDWVLYGGEDYQLVACVDKENLNKINPDLYTVIGEVQEKMPNSPLRINFGNKIHTIKNLNKSFNHFNK